jgi:hypothetical protein
MAQSGGANNGSEIFRKSESIFSFSSSESEAF